MKKNVILTGVILSLLILFSTAYAERTIWYVHPDSALNTIQAGLDSCATNDIVLVAPGTYYENIIWPSTQGIHLLSELGPDTTIIDGDSSGSVIALFSGTDTTTVISGFTIQHGYSEQGGGILCSNHSSPYITGNIIMDNIASGLYHSGAGIACTDSASPIITCNVIKYNTGNFGGGGIICANYSQAIIGDNTISNNTAWLGGGIFCEISSAIITGNTISYNSCEYNETIKSHLCSVPKGINGIYAKRCPSEGGGIFCNESSPFIDDNNIFGNSADYGGGISLLFCSPIVTGNTISENTADYFGGGIICMGDSSATIAGNIITGNEAEWGSGICCLYGSSPNIDSCTISNNYGDGIYCDQTINPVINHNNITDNTGYGVRNVDSSVTVNAEYNWWGDSTGPGGVGPGTGDEVSEYVDYEPWLFAPVGVEEEARSQKQEA
ncbi:right-handed parallel beta-helix repeat-containing protein, partial [candidate division WOR-3 bacterium]|nr:right-handed parallel beta-helix repeat-containing protein [candidate division WOR-3 bacterium]